MLEAFIIAWMISGLVVLLGIFLTDPAKFELEDAQDVALIIGAALAVIFLGWYTYWYGVRVRIACEKKERELAEEKMRELLCPDLPKHTPSLAGQIYGNTVSTSLNILGVRVL